jgi:AcrR family transcriptional regulator
MAPVSYHQTGRTAQKGRTREALLAATAEFLDEGAAPTVEQAADRAGVSRTTAYRYFANQRELLSALDPELDAASLLPPDPPQDVEARLDVVLDRYLDHVLRREAALRAQLRISLEPGRGDDPLPFRQGRAIGWFEEALSPLRDQLGARRHRRLALGIRAATGIEALVWLTDVGGLSRAEATDLMRDSARALLRAAMSP